MRCKAMPISQPKSLLKKMLHEWRCPKTPHPLPSSHAFAADRRPPGSPLPSRRGGPIGTAASGTGNLGTARGRKTAPGAVAGPAGPVRAPGVGAVRTVPTLSVGRRAGIRGSPLVRPDPPPQGGGPGQGRGRGGPGHRRSDGRAAGQAPVRPDRRHGEPLDGLSEAAASPRVAHGGRGSPPDLHSGRRRAAGAAGVESG